MNVERAIRTGLVACMCLSAPALGRALEPQLVVNVQGAAVTLGMEALARLQPEVIHVESEAGTPVAYDCVALFDVLNAARGAPAKKRRGKAMMDRVIVHASDGYEILFSMAELDADFAGRKVDLCFGQNGANLPTEVGPFRLVVPDDKRHARWIRHVESINLIEEEQP